MLFIGGIVPGWRMFWNLVGIAAFIFLAVFVYSTFFAPPEDVTDAVEKCLDQIKPRIKKDVYLFAHNEKNERDYRGFVVAHISDDTPN